MFLATNPTTLTLQVSTDNGSTWKTTGVYTNNLQYLKSGSVGYGGTASDTFIWLTYTNVTNTTVPISGQVYFSNPNNTASPCVFSGQATYSVAGTMTNAFPAGYYNTTGTAINAIRILAASGNITSGTFRLYGLQKS